MERPNVSWHPHAALPVADGRPSSKPRLPRIPYLGPIVLGGLVALYFFAVLVGPLVSLALELATVGLGPVIQGLLKPAAIDALQMSILLTAIAVLVNGVFGVAGALILVRGRFRGQALLSLLADLPLAISPVMVGLGFLLLVGQGGTFSPLLTALNLQLVFSFPGLVIGTLFVTLPYTVREVAYILTELGTSEEEAAATLGASEWQTFFKITLPNIRFGLALGLLMTTARALGEFGAVLVLGGSISGNTQTATTFIHDALEERNTADAYGMAALLCVISMLLLFLLEYFKRRTKARQS